MRKLHYFLMIGTVLCIFVAGLVFAQDDIKKHASCRYCGMDRAKFAHSRVYVEYDDGTTQGTCSLHCAAIDLAINIDKTPKAIRVGDYNTKHLIEAEKAFWVIDGKKMGVMTQRAKWAFEKKKDAEEFIRENGGKPAAFEEAMEAAYEDMYQDTKMVREMRRIKMREHRPQGLGHDSE